MVYIPLHSVFTKQVDLNVRQCAPISQHNKLPDIPIGHSFRLVIVPILLLHSSCSEKSPVGWHFLLSIPLTIRTISTEPLQKTLMLLQSFKELPITLIKIHPFWKKLSFLHKFPFFFSYIFQGGYLPVIHQAQLNICLLSTQWLKNAILIPCPIMVFFKNNRNSVAPSHQLFFSRVFSDDTSAGVIY